MIGLLKTRFRSEIRLEDVAAGAEVGILGDFVVWFGEASDRTSTVLSPKPTRFGDYVHVRLAHPDTRFFSAFGYALLTDAAPKPPERTDYLYVEFGREAVASSGLH